MRHTYIKPGSPNLNGKVERSHSPISSSSISSLSTPTTSTSRRSSRSGRSYSVHRPNAGLRG